MSGDMVIRAVAGEEVIEAAAPLRAYAFQPSPKPPELEAMRRRLPYAAEHRVLVAYDGDAPVATATTVPCTQAVRGAVFPMNGVSAVAVHPGARRRGLARRLVAQLLAEGAAAGEALTCLYPFRESFYGRLGYVGLPQLRVATLDPRTLVPLLSLDLPGSVELCPIGDALPAYRDLLLRLQPATHGMALRTETSFGALAETEQWLVLVRDAAGAVTGAMQYQIKSWRGELQSQAWFAATVPARYQLLQWLAQHADQASTAVLQGPPDTYAETWHTDLEATTASRTDFVAPMGRVLSLPALAGLPVGAAPEPAAPEVAIAVADPFCPWNEGTWLLASDAGRLAVERTTAEPAATLTAHGLAALVYGGYDPAEFPLRGWGDPDPAICAALGALFPTPPRLPYLYAEF